MLALTFALLAATTTVPEPSLVTSGNVTLSMEEVAALRATAAATTPPPRAILSNVIPNPGFESGALPPWETNNWTITSTDPQTGTFAAEDIGNYWIRYCFSPIAVADIRSITFWSKQPEAAIQAVDFYYSATDYDEFIVFPLAGWTLHDVTARLRPVGSLQTLRVWGYSGGGPGADLTRADTFLIDSATPATSCIPFGRCGDGMLDPGETCDNGPLNSDTVPDACRLNCVPAHCGDGVLDTGEECDDNNNIPGDGCSDNCKSDACLLGSIQPVQLLKGVKSSDRASVILSWSPDVAASGYNTWFVGSKPLIPSAREPGGAGVFSVPGCHPSVPATCTHVNGVPAASGVRLYYQVRGACTGMEAPE